MSNGYLLAAEADFAAVGDIGEGFGLDVIGASALGDHEATAATLASAANVGIVLSTAAAADANYVSLLQALATRLSRAQLIVADAEARAAFPFLPEMWPVMSLDEARMRANAIMHQRQPSAPPRDEQPTPPAIDQAQADPLPETPTEPEPEPHVEELEENAASDQKDAELEDSLSDESATGGAAPGADSSERAESFAAPDDDTRSVTEAAPPSDEPPPAPPVEERLAPPPQMDEPVAGAPPPSVTAPAPAPAMPPPQASAPEAPMPPVTRSPQAPSQPARERSAGEGARAGRGAATAPADATAFAPKKLRRATPELVRIVIHQPKDLNAVIKAARKTDTRTEPAPQGMSIGDVALGSSVGISLEVRGAACDGTLQRRTWNGEPIDFNFSVEAEQGVKQAVLLARVFVDDAQIGILAFTRNVSGPSKKPASDGDRVRLKRHKRVFLSYSSKDREVVSAIATAYERAGVEHFWDRASLKSGEEWSPRLRKEIERADLFHLCWSKSASQSEWVQKEAEHALTRRKRNSGKPEITVQMLDGPPWAPHPASLDSINFDDFVRAAIIGYARGDASQDA